jgi:di/tricarboxylate transporter
MRSVVSALLIAPRLPRLASSPRQARLTRRSPAPPGTSTCANHATALCAADGAAALSACIATPTNLMVMAPGGYQFGDYWKLGLPLLIWFFVISVFYMPLVWRF